MAHEITIRADGRAEAMYARQPAWHGLGTVVENAPTSIEALRLAGLDWDIVPAPVYRERSGAFETIDGSVALTRSDTGSVLSVVSDTYGVVHNREAAEMLDGLQQDGLLRYEAMMSLRGGRIVILLARMPGVMEVADGDTVKRYVMLQTSHDGTTACHLKPTSVRVVCANTWRMAMSDGELTFRIPHTSGVKDRIENAVSVIRTIEGRFADDLGRCRALARQSISDATFKAYLDEVMPAADEKATDTQKRAADALRTDVSSRYFEGDCQQLPAIRRTLWAAFNAVTEHVDHAELAAKRLPSANRAEAAFSRKLLGSGHDLKTRAWQAASERLVPAEL